MNIQKRDLLTDCEGGGGTNRVTNAMVVTGWLVVKISGRGTFVFPTYCLNFPWLKSTFVETTNLEIIRTPFLGPSETSLKSFYRE